MLDPEGVVTANRVERVPFELTAADAGVDVILLTPNTKIVDFRLQTPNGFLIEPWLALSEPGMRFVLSEGVTYYRLVLPVELVRDRFDGGGTWHALLTIGRPRMEPTRTHDRPDSPPGVDRSIVRGMFAAPQPARVRPAAAMLMARLRRSNMLRAERIGDPAAAAFHPTVAVAAQSQQVRYSLVVHTYSNLTLQAHVEQRGFEPGARVDIYASLAESGIPLTEAARVWVDVTKPNGTTETITLTATESGQFVGWMTAVTSGAYRLRVRARGTTSRGEPFTREKTLSAAVWRGDLVVNPEGGGGVTDDHDGLQPDCLCQLLVCLLRREGVIGSDLEKRLREVGFDLEQARKCIEGFCRCRKRQH